ncbi:MAG: MGMT family protein [Blastocatellia bacterium]
MRDEEEQQVQRKRPSPEKPRLQPGYRERVYALVLRIPPGYVMSYGQLARLLGEGYDARAIGNVMHATPQDERQIPWHRVINAQGGCSTAGLTQPPDLQQRLLEMEGVQFDEKGRCRIDDYRWSPPEEDLAQLDGGWGKDL